MSTRGSSKSSGTSSAGMHALRCWGGRAGCSGSLDSTLYLDAGSIPARGICGGRLNGRGGELITPEQVRSLPSALRLGSPRSMGSSGARDLLHAHWKEAASGTSRGNRRVSGGSTPPPAICACSSLGECHGLRPLEGGVQFSTRAFFVDKQCAAT